MPATRIATLVSRPEFEFAAHCHICSLGLFVTDRTHVQTPGYSISGTMTDIAICRDNQRELHSVSSNSTSSGRMATCRLILTLHAIGLVAEIGILIVTLLGLMSGSNPNVDTESRQQQLTVTLVALGFSMLSFCFTCLGAGSAVSGVKKIVRRISSHPLIAQRPTHSVHGSVHEPVNKL